MSNAREYPPNTTRTRARLATLTVAVAIAGTAVGIASALRAPAAAATSETTNVQAAVQYAAARGYHTSAAVLNTHTGRFYGAGDYTSTYASESVVKVFIAARLLAGGQMTGRTEAMAYQMITQSDDNMANALYGRVGGDGLINWVKAYFHIPHLGTPPSRPGWWGNTHITARGLVYFYNVLKRNYRIGPWIINAMHHATSHGADGVYQFFGIPSATTGFGVKQGWGTDYGNGSASFNSTGYVNNNRYAVAILVRGPISSYGKPIADILTAMARIIMPGGQVAVPAAHNPIGHVDHALTNGSSVQIDGWNLDPDYKATSIYVGIYEGTHRLFHAATSLYNASVNRTYHSTGNHGFSFSFNALNGTHTYCVVYYNIGEGTGNPQVCSRVAVNGAPFGYVDTTTLNPDNSVSLTGWDADRDDKGQSISVQVYEGTTLLGTFPANLPRPDVNIIKKIPGDHGFDVMLANQTPGPHTYSVFGVNIGFAGPNILLTHSPTTVTVPTPAPPPPPFPPATSPPPAPAPGPASVTPSR